MWRYPNFSVLVGVALSCYLWFGAMFFLIITMWQEVYDWSAVKSAVQCVFYLSSQWPACSCFISLYLASCPSDSLVRDNCLLISSAS